jgi:hypothetical protein
MQRAGQQFVTFNITFEDMDDVGVTEIKIPYAQRDRARTLSSVCGLR